MDLNRPAIGPNGSVSGSPRHQAAPPAKVAGQRPWAGRGGAASGGLPPPARAGAGVKSPPSKPGCLDPPGALAAGRKAGAQDLPAVGEGAKHSRPTNDEDAAWVGPVLRPPRIIRISWLPDADQDLRHWRRTLQSIGPALGGHHSWLGRPRPAHWLNAPACFRLIPRFSQVLPRPS